MDDPRASQPNPSASSRRAGTPQSSDVPVNFRTWGNYATGCALVFVAILMTGAVLQCIAVKYLRQPVDSPMNSMQILLLFVMYNHIMLSFRFVIGGQI